MKPVSLRFKCFGPYVQEQFIDFAQLESNGLFLICGETGSGKTTILDAMCYALYGCSSGGLRGELPVMRCKQADVKEDTFVEYIFDIGEKRYRFYRQMKLKKTRYSAAEDGMRLLKTDDFSMFFECQIMRDGEFVPMQDGKDKQTYLNKKAEELLGLSYEQFRQVIVLPQGQFEKLLVSDSAEKEKILVTLFHAEKWQKIAKKLCDDAAAESRELDMESNSMKEKLRSYGCDSIAALEEKAEEEKAQAQENSEKLSAAEKELGLMKAENEKLIIEAREFQNLEELRKKYEKLLPREDEFKKEEEILSLSDKADAVKDKYTAFCDAFREKDWYRKNVEQDKENLSKTEAAYKKAENEKRLHEQSRDEYEKNKSHIILLENSRELYKSLKGLELEARAAEKESCAAEETADSAQKVYKRANKAWLDAALRQREVIEEFKSTQTAYLACIGSTLAEKLVEGEACPVCGSKSHPHPAEISEGHVSEEELDRVSMEMDSANKAETEKRRKNSEAEEKNRSAQEKLAEKKQLAALKSAELEAALVRRVENIKNEDELNKELIKRQNTVREFEKQEEELQEKLNSSAAGLESLRIELQRAQKQLDEAAEEYSVQEKIWMESRSGAGFQDDNAYTEACMEAEEKNIRREKLLKFRAELSSSKGSYDEKKKELEGRERPDILSAKKALDEKQSLRDGLKSRLVLQEKNRDDMLADIGKLKKRREAYDEKRRANEEAMGFAKRLRGDSGVSLQRYVLGVMLSSVTAAANRLLKTVYGGRYQLYRSDEVSGSSHKKGLELEVEDANGRRSVTTLSGGEKFLLALSLAIGLSTVVQAQGGGVRLEAMFIDEGFGSLDSNSIDDALEILQGIRRSSCMVGIISHVERLRETIPAKIQIEKTGEGSRCKICC